MLYKTPLIYENEVLWHFGSKQGGVLRDGFVLIDVLKSLQELLPKEFHLSQGVVIIIVLVVCFSYVSPAFWEHQEKMEDLRNQQTRTRWEHEEALEDDRLEEQKIAIEKEKAQAEAELEWTRLYLECGGSLEDLPAEWKSKFFSLYTSGENP